MKTYAAVVLLEILLNHATSMIHTVRYYQTYSSQVPDVPELVYVGVVNDLEIMHCDSQTKRFEPKQDWMKTVTDDDPKFWEWNTRNCLNSEQEDKGNLENVKKSLNKTGGVHIWQRMYGCEWDDETDKINGYMQFAFDGEDFLSLDLEAETWVAAKQQAFTTKQRLERRGYTDICKHYFHHVCALWLKNFVRYGETTMKRKVLPQVSFLQKSSSSPVTCHATGFYPDQAMLFWTKDGEEVTEDVDPGEILPNGDGTFQTSVDLDLTSVPSGDWEKYECVFQLSGVAEDQKYSLGPNTIRTNAKKGHTTIIIIVVLVILGIVISVAAAVTQFLIRKKKVQSVPQAQQDLHPVFQLRGTSQDDEVTEKLNSKACAAELPG